MKFLMTGRADTEPCGIGRAVPTVVMLALIAVGLGVIDGILPRPLPFLKTGLANVVTVMVAFRMGTARALSVNLLRVIAVALFLGSIATPSFLMSLAGGLSSAFFMGLLSRTARHFLSVTGISIAGSMASLSAQLAVAVLIIRGIPVASIVVPLAAWGVLSGTVTGLLATLLLRRKFLERAPFGLVPDASGG